VHGHNFDVILGTDATVPNFVNPPRRDVINSASGVFRLFEIRLTPKQTVSGGNTTFRFFTNNPGAWFLHW
jgi:iron transport multicopper oxidase